MLLVTFLLASLINIQEVFAINQWVDRDTFDQSLGGSLLWFSVSDLQPKSAWEITQVNYQDTDYLVFSRNHGDGIIEPKSVQAIPDNTLLGYRRCSQSGGEIDFELMAVFHESKEQILRSPIEAYRANRETGMIEQIPSADITCENPYPYH